MNQTVRQEHLTWCQRVLACVSVGIEEQVEEDCRRNEETEEERTLGRWNKALAAPALRRHLLEQGQEAACGLLREAGFLGSSEHQAATRQALNVLMWPSESFKNKEYSEN